MYRTRDENEKKKKLFKFFIHFRYYNVIQYIQEGR